MPSYTSLRGLLFRPWQSFIIFAFLLNTTSTPGVEAADFVLPAPGQMVSLSPAYNPPVLKGIQLDPKNLFRFHFFVDTGDEYRHPKDNSHPERSEGSQQEQLKQESAKLIKYFLASLTIPEKDLWVNLSPYEKDRIVPQEFGQTEMGRDLLAEDYILKQITASLIYPESQLGKEFWNKVYAQAEAKYGTTNIPINTFNKVWIVPDKAVVYENGGTAFVLENHLKVMLEEDYLSMSKHQSQPGDMFPAKRGTCPQAGCQARKPLNVKASQVNPNSTNELGSQIVREIVIPQLEHEVNYGKNFAQLRQVFYSLILATWYKKKIKDSILNRVYSNRNKIGGMNVSAQDKERIYQEYLRAFKRGVFNYIQEDSDPVTGQDMPRKYFSGGVNAQLIGVDLAMVGPKQLSNIQRSALDSAQVVDVDTDMAMINQNPETVSNDIKASPEILRLWNGKVMPVWGKTLNAKLYMELFDYGQKLWQAQYKAEHNGFGNEVPGDKDNPSNIANSILYWSILNFVKANYPQVWKKEGPLLMEYLKRRDDPQWNAPLLSTEEETQIGELAFLISRVEEMAWMESSVYARTLGRESSSNPFVQPLYSLFLWALRTTGKRK